MFETEFAENQDAEFLHPSFGLAKDTMLLTEFVVYIDSEFLHPS